MFAGLLVFCLLTCACLLVVFGIGDDEVELEVGGITCGVVMLVVVFGIGDDEVKLEVGGMLVWCWI
jgi:hypothetical protein